MDGVKTTALPLDRLLLGVGSPNPEALKRVRAGIAELRSSSRRASSSAALGPQMCRLAGEVADGVRLRLADARVRAPVGRARARGRRGGASLSRQVYAYLRVALGPTAGELLQQEANRYAAVPAYAANFTRMGLKPVETAIAAQNRDDVQRGLAPWNGVVDHIIVARSPPRTRSTSTSRS